ncbi:MAG: DUF748 domain-containing protein, partial [Holophaga sp.]|nr:DUF748 domain-containing protein [Holophaga sp.]
TMEGVLFDTGKIEFKGAADFLHKPHASAQGEIRLQQVPLDRLDPIGQKFNLKTTGGLLSLDGALEYTPEFQLAHLREVLFEDLQVDYITRKATKSLEKEHGKQVAKLAKSVRDAPQLMLRVNTLKMSNGQIGFVNEGTTPTYRLGLSRVNLNLENLNNEGNQGRSTFLARGAFMGSGATEVSGGFRPTASSPDFDIHLKLDDAKLTTLNNFLLAHSGVDVADGMFSLYSEMRVHNGRIEGYMKPLVKNLMIYDRQKDKGKPFGKRVKMRALQVLATLFKNHSTREVATVIRISGSTHHPKASEWEAIRKLIGNGLFRGILPGFLGPRTPPKPEGKSPPVPARTTAR